MSGTAHGRCSVANCFAPDGSCHLGSTHYSECSKWEPIAAADDEATAGGVSERGHEYVPRWTGRVMGLVDLRPVVSRSSSVILALVGAPDAGKTTLLQMLYVLLAGSGRLGSWSFAGSYTMAAWEGFATAAKFTVNGPATFPPHTTSADPRSPGFLHLALRRGSGPIRDLLVGDCPGEWFRDWTLKESHPNAAGARLIVGRADVAVMVVDSGAIAGAERGGARRATVDLFMRLAASQVATRTMLLWSKSDLAVPEAMEEQIERARALHLPKAAVYRCSVTDDPAKTVLPAFLDAILDLAPRRPQSVDPAAAPDALLSL